MNILYIGSGFVGACSAAVSASSGHNTLVYDIDQRKIDALGSADRDKIENCLFEEGLADLLIRNKDHIEFTTDYSLVEKFLDNCDAVFMCLPTPEIGETGESDLSYYFKATESLSDSLIKRNSGRQEKYIVIINKSTVPIDMVDRTEEVLKEKGANNFGVASNPEFLVEGKAIQGSVRPSRVVVGARRDKDFSIMRQLYARLYDSPNVRYIEVNPKEAAAGRLLANFYLFSKLALCFDVIGRTCESFSDLKFENLRNILISDTRISDWGFYDSLYAGGSCFIKDSRSLSHQLQTEGKTASLINEVYSANKRQLELFISRAEHEAKFDWKGKRVALLGTAFKRDTNGIRNSASLDLMHFFQEQQTDLIKVYDPAANVYFKQVFPASDIIEYCDTAQETVQEVDAVIIATDWPQFRRLADYFLENFKDGRRPLIMDGRRMWQHRYDDLQKAGFDIIAVGSPFISNKQLNK